MNRWETVCLGLSRAVALATLALLTLPSTAGNYVRDDQQTINVTVNDTGSSFIFDASTGT